MHFCGAVLTGIAYSVETGETVGLYILHPNNVGRCGTSATRATRSKAACAENTSAKCWCATAWSRRKTLGFGILQFNAVVKSNLPALQLYKKLGFVQLGTIPGGFRMPDGGYADIIPHYIVL